MRPLSQDAEAVTADVTALSRALKRVAQDREMDPERKEKLFFHIKSAINILLDGEVAGRAET